MERDTFYVRQVEPKTPSKTDRMPEGPEIHREADKIRDAIGGEICSYAFFYHDHLKPFEAELTGRKIISVEARGKGMIIRLEDDNWFYSHNQLYGKWYIKPAGSYPKTNRQLRAELQTAKKSALLYSASEIDVMDGDSIEDHPYLSSLGPDILSDVSAKEIQNRTAGDTFNGRSFAALLLDQHFLGGVGNYLRSEILFHSGIDPSRRPKDLSKDELETFSKSVLTIAHRSYESGGITLDDKRVREARNRGEKRKQYRHYVFARDGKPCRQCGTDIEKIAMSGRRLYLCKNCQS